MSSIPEPKTLTYSFVDDLEIKLDLYVPPDAQGALPAIVYFHGGGLAIGNREIKEYHSTWILGPLVIPYFSGTALTFFSVEMTIANGMIFISPDYRKLLPCTVYDEIADIEKLYEFLASDVNSHLPEEVTLDMSRIAIAGISAGAYLGRLASLYAESRPCALFSLYGMGGDWLLDHWVNEKEGQMEFLKFRVLQEDVAHLETAKPIADVPWKINSDTNKMEDPYGRFNLLPWWWQNGEYIDQLLGERGLSKTLRSLPYAERASAVPSDISKIFPQLHIDAKFPPTFFIHGDQDTLVPLSESTHMYQQLQSLEVRTELHIVEGAEHGLVMKDPKPETAAEIKGMFEQAFQFMLKELGGADAARSSSSELV